jgi:hypothetical protein
MSNARKLSLFLAEYNLWRRGGLDEMPSSHTPAEIGVALDEAVYLLKKYDELERDELRKLRAELDCSCNAEELTRAFDWLQRNAPVSIRYMTGSEQWSLPPAYCVLVKDRLFYGTTVFHAVREAMRSES